MVSFIDGSWFDIATLGVAGLYACYRCYQHAAKRSWEFFAGELSYGVIILPMLMLANGYFQQSVGNAA